MSNAVRGFLIFVVLAVVAGAVYWFVLREKPAPAPAPALAPPAATPAPAPAAPSGEGNAPPLPGLADSDPDVMQALARLLGSGAEGLILRPGIVHRIVATVDNLPGTKVPQQVMLVKPPGGAFVTVDDSGHKAISPANAARYARYVSLVSALDIAQLVATYRHYYPLFQQAYRELGYPKGEFNDRLVEAIDDMLEAPQPEPPVALVSPRAMFDYAKPELQDASAGQKILMRLGPESEGRVKVKLRELRRALDSVDLPR
ncbi:MAG TPA: DUF3014 domain-containing protein [Burkholderiaceae bacterium]|jgi:hypothetical protein|nr:DUF3014 domain-containing protein [Burkholderiaceae bacterium]